MTEAGRTDVRRIREAAADWALRLEDEDCGAAERRACEAWLDRDPAHRDAFDLARRVMGESARAFAGAPAAAYPARPAPRRRMRAPFAMAAAAAVACLAFFAADGPARLAADARSGAGETPVIRLADGSTMRLNGETAVALDLDAGARRVSLIRGQAYFEVAHDPARPFIVEAAGGEVMALGTAFDVNLVGGGVEVTVTESQIRATTAAGAREIAAGSRIAYDGAGAFGAVRDAPANLAAAWRFDRLAFEDRPLGRVAEALDRCLPGRLVVVGENLAARRVSGSFDIAEADRALDAMTSVFGLRKVSLGPWLTLLY